MKPPAYLSAIVVFAAVLVAVPVVRSWSRPPIALADAPAPADATSAYLSSVAPDAAPPAASVDAVPYQVGIASWYGPGFQGMQTTSGQAYNMYALTAAHRTLPLGTQVRVTDLINHRSVVLRINDRGPVPQTRVIDLSYAAARALDFSGAGLAPVRIDLVGIDEAATR